MGAPVRRVSAVSASVVIVGLVGGELVGCRAILGIEDEDGRPSPSADAWAELDAQDGGDSAPGAEDASDAASDGAFDFDAGATDADRRYAIYPLPPPGPALSNYELKADTVLDKTTSLVWQRNETAPVTMGYGAAALYCENLALEGATDWRLPTRMELLTILDYAQRADVMNRSVFPNGARPSPTLDSWTSSLSLLRASLDDRFVVDTGASHVNIASNAAVSLLVRCVRGGPATSPAIRYDLGTAGTARDVRTGLVWQRTPLAATKTLSEADAECSALALGGFSSGWRLPNVRELASLIDESREAAPLLAPPFESGPRLRFWSSTRRTNPATANYAVDFGTANIHQEDFSTEKFAVRCVR